MIDDNDWGLEVSTVKKLNLVHPFHGMDGGGNIGYMITLTCLFKSLGKLD